ncbi:MAG: DUF2314 domain-containing protein [Planctomycetaceae bacterium]|nr:DUF2314 domain-containing protein [Planctomycetaceae bacterium]
MAKFEKNAGREHTMNARQIGGNGAMLLVGMLIAFGCGSNEHGAGTTVERQGQPPVTYVEDDDPRMVAAIDQARSTVDQFIAVLDGPKPTQSAFSVKLPVKSGDEVEHIWVLPVRYERSRFFGTINNEPVSVTTVKIGDEISVAKDQISDWMYVEDRKLIGGYTLRALRDSMSEEERREFDQSLPFTIE